MQPQTRQYSRKNGFRSGVVVILWIMSVLLCFVIQMDGSATETSTQPQLQLPQRQPQGADWSDHNKQVPTATTTTTNSSTKEWIVGTGVWIVTPLSGKSSSVHPDPESSFCFSSSHHYRNDTAATTKEATHDSLNSVLASVFEISRIVITVDTAINASTGVINETLAIVVPTGHRFYLSDPDVVMYYASNNRSNTDNNYGGMVGNTTVVVVDFRGMDDIVREMNRNVSRYLSGYNCRDFYPYYTCLNCTDSYAGWSCGTMFPLARVVLSSSLTDASPLNPAVVDSTLSNLPTVDTVKHLPACRELCHRVMQTCPVHLEFECSDPTAQNNNNCVKWESSTPNNSSNNIL